MTFCGRYDTDRTMPDNPGVERLRKAFAGYSNWEEPMRGQMLHNRLLQHMANACGIDASLKDLLKFADLIRADYLQEQIDGYNRFKANQPLMLEHTP
jgi:hypothetical protein